jgi:hypothetical protein
MQSARPIAWIRESCELLGLEVPEHARAEH